MNVNAFPGASLVGPEAAALQGGLPNLMLNLFF